MMPANAPVHMGPPMMPPNAPIHMGPPMMPSAMFLPPKASQPVIGTGHFQPNMPVPMPPIMPSVPPKVGPPVMPPNWQNGPVLSLPWNPNFPVMPPNPSKPNIPVMPPNRPIGPAVPYPPLNPNISAPPQTPALVCPVCKLSKSQDQFYNDVKCPEHPTMLPMHPNQRRKTLP